MVELPPADAYEEIYLENEMGCWMYPPRSMTSNEHVMIYFNGNAGNVSTRLSNIRVLQHLFPEYRIYNLEYPGFGISASLPGGLTAIAEECEAACRHILEKHPLLETMGFWGESLGALVAAHVFSRLSNRVRWVVHMNGVASLHDALAAYVPPLLQAFVLPVLPTLPGPVVEAYEAVDIQEGHHIVLMHAKNDEVVSDTHTKQLYVALKARYPNNVHYLELRGKHNGVLLHKENQDAMTECVGSIL